MKKIMNCTPNYHAFHVTYHGWTHTKPNRLKIKSLRFHKQYIWVSIGDNDFWLDDAIEYLVKIGYKIVGQAEYSGNGFILISDIFKPLKDE